MLTRRRLLTSSLAAGLAMPALTRRVWALTSLDLGGATLDTLSDGNLVLPGDFVLGGLPQDEAKAILADFGLAGDQFTPPCNVTLFRDGTNTVLFDVGAGPDFMASAGKLPEALDAVGLSPDDITHVIFTHAHPDHLWGTLDEFDEPLFPSAELMMGRAEFDYWTDPATVETIDPGRTTFAVGAARRLEVLADSLRLLDDGDEAVPGVTARLTPGHTPGHMGFEIAAGGASAMVVGDAIGNHHLAFVRPDWPSASDQDPEPAAATRSALLASLADTGMPFVGFHLPDGGIGRVERTDDGGYRYVSA